MIINKILNKKKTVTKRYNRLFFRVYLYYAVMLLVFAVLIGIIFIRLFEQNTMKIYSDQLKEEAHRISIRISEFIETDDYIDYPSYIETLQDMEASDIWIISNKDAKNPMNSKFENVNLENIDLKENKIEKIIKNAFHDKVTVETHYMNIYGAIMRVVGEPIYGEDKEVVGAVLLISQKESQTSVIQTSQYLLVISLLVGLFISFIIAIIFARKLSLPILKMRGTALELADGHYDKKTGITQHDEIGELATTIDILSDKLQENEIERNNMEQMRLDFFANVSHELRTPITVVRAYIEMLVDGVVTDQNKIAGYYSRMLNECKSMERLVGDLLILSKMQNPDFLVEVEPINVVQIFEDIIRSVHAISLKKDIKIQVNKESDCYMMLGDYDRIRQMFMIILDNAIKFSNEHSTIYITMSCLDKLMISIRDEGIGISEEDLPNIFDKFYKSKLRQNATGSGLGLAIAKQICLKHGGTIEVSSKLKVGTTFNFTFEPIYMEKESMN